MAKFCTRCGKKLYDKEKCTCDKIKKEKSVNNNSSFISVMEKMLKNPYDYLNNIEEQNDNSYLYLLCMALSFGIISLTMPFRYLFANFISVTIISFMIMIFISCIIYGIFNCFYKENISLKKVIDIVSVSSIILIFLNMLAFIFKFISPIISFLIIILELVLFIINLYQGLLFNTSINKNKISYLLTISIFITLFIILSIIK